MSSTLTIKTLVWKTDQTTFYHEGIVPKCAVHINPDLYCCTLGLRTHNYHIKNV